MPITTIGRTEATGQGVSIRSELRVRSVPTWDGDKIVKLGAAGYDEGPFSLANELIGTGIAERLGLWQPRRWVVEIPHRISSIAGWSPKLRHRLAAGADMDEAFKAELDNAPVVAGARTQATGESVLATLVLLDWLRLGDHADHNFVLKDSQIIPIDFASAPGEEVWRGAIAAPLIPADPGGLRAELPRVTPSESDAVRTRFDRIGAKALNRIARLIPTEMTEGLTSNVIDVVLRTKEEIRDAYWP
jgi:hypothetical protein